MLIFELSKEDLKIAQAEIETVIGKKGELIENFLFADVEIRDYSRLAYTKNIYELLLKGNVLQIKKNLKNIKFNEIVVHNFKIEDQTGKLLETVADFINKPVNLKSPETLIEIIEINKKVYLTRLLQRIKHDFDKRKPSKRPICYPFSLKPKIARAMVNLTGIKKGESIIDPFCGTGGLLLEAALIGCRVEGVDIDERMVKACSKNLDGYGIRKYNIYEGDATELKQRLLYVVTDLPYARNTKNQDLERLYEGFLKVIEKYLEYRAVIGCPDSIDMKKMIKKHNLKLVGKFSYFLHSTLTKKIFVIEPKG